MAVPLPGPPVTSLRLWHNTRGTDIPLLQYPVSPVLIQVQPEEYLKCIITLCLVSYTYIPNTEQNEPRTERII